MGKTEKRKKTYRMEAVQTASRASKIGENAVFPLLVVLACAFFFKDALLGRRTLIWDAADYFYPIFFTVSHTLRNWKIPLWNPFLFNGFPNIANIEAQIFYPVNLLFLPFTSFTPYTLFLSMILHYLLAGLSMYCLANHFLKDRTSSLMSAMVYMFSGFMIGHLEHVTMIEVAAWLPLIFLLLEKSLTEKKLRYAALGGIAWGVSLLAGHPQTSYGIGLILVIHWIYRTVGDYISHGKEGLRHNLAAIIILFAGGVLIAAVQILPTMELVLESVRGSALSFAHAAAGGQLSLRDMIGLLVPNYFGALRGPYWGDLDISQNITYVGVVTLLLMGIAILSARKKADVRYFLSLAIFFVLISLGANTPVFHLLFKYLPGFDYFRGPANNIFLFTFCAAILSGYGFAALSKNVSLKVVAACWAVLCAIGLAIYFMPLNPPDYIAVEAVRNMDRGVAWSFFFLCAAAITIVCCLYYPKARKVGYAVLLILSFSDMYGHLSAAHTAGLPGSPDYYEKEPAAITKIKEYSGVVSNGQPAAELNQEDVERSLFRIYTSPSGPQGIGIFGYNRAMIHGTFLVEGFEPLDMSRHRKLYNFLSKRNPANYMKISNVRYISRTEGNRVELEAYPDAFPRAFIVSRARFMSDDSKALDELAVMDPGSEVVISGTGTDVGGQAMDRRDWSAVITKYKSDDVEIMTQSAKDGFLVLSDTFYPGWRAWVDGVQVPVMRANYDYRAISLPQGSHTVIFKFRSRYLNIGIFLSLVTLGVLLSFLFWDYRREKSGR